LRVIKSNAKDENEFLEIVAGIIAKLNDRCESLNNEKCILENIIIEMKNSQ
jgi:hypothetical protein